MTRRARLRQGESLRGYGRCGYVAALALALAACDSLVEVNDPEVITPSDLDGQVGVEVLHAGGVGDFAVGWRGQHGVAGQVTIGGLLADEWIDGAPVDPPAADAGTDQRMTPLEASIPYDLLHRARRALEVAAERITALSPDPSQEPRISELYSLAGYAYIAFGENYCSGVPFSTASTSGALHFGQPLTTTEIFEIAVERFDQALANTGHDPEMDYLAHVGKARVLLNLGEHNPAAAEVASVPTSFQYVIEHSDNSVRERNAVYVINAELHRLSLADIEGNNGLPFRSANDPRVPWTETVSRRTGGPQYNLLKYPDASAPLVLADGIEARLIEAEALLRGGDATGWLAIVNQLRTDAGMGALADPATDAGRVDLHFRERAFWFFATGHRLGDLRRLIRQYGRDAESVFPTGAYFKGGVYGPDVNLPVPLQEQNNPNFQGCLDRGA